MEEQFNNTNITKSYYINLDHRQDRNLHFLKEISKCKYFKYHINRYPGIYGQNLDIQDLDNSFITDQGKKEVIDNTQKYWGISLTYGGVGATLTHYNIYRECFYKKYNSVFIFEDDIYIDSLIDQYLDQIYVLDFSTFDILYFGYHGHSLSKNKINNFFSKVTGGIYGMFGYLVTQRGADNLIHKVFPITTQLDSAITHNIKNNNIVAYVANERVVTSEPSCYHSKFGTDIQGINGIKNQQANPPNDPLEDVFCTNKN